MKAKTKRANLEPVRFEDLPLSEMIKFIKRRNAAIRKREGSNAKSSSRKQKPAMPDIEAELRRVWGDGFPGDVAWAKYGALVS